jgi:hypothetical protein
VSIFRHPLLQHFMLTVFCKLPVVSLSSMGDLKYSFMVRLILSAFQFRINQRWVLHCQPLVGCVVAAVWYHFGCCVVIVVGWAVGVPAHSERIPVQNQSRGGAAVWLRLRCCCAACRCVVGCVFGMLAM